MLTLSVDLDIDTVGIVQSRTVKVSQVFPICVYVGVETGTPADVEFDTLVIEVFFNDGMDAIVRVDPTDRPVIGAIAHYFPGTIDAFRDGPVSSGRAMTQSAAIAYTPLSLFGFASSEPLGPYLGRTGRAGIRKTDGPIVIRSGSQYAVALGKATAGLRGNVVGTTQLIAQGTALLNGNIVPTYSIPSVLQVQP